MAPLAMHFKGSGTINALDDTKHMLLPINCKFMNKMTATGMPPVGAKAGPMIGIKVGTQNSPLRTRVGLMPMTLC